MTQRADGGANAGAARGGAPRVRAAPVSPDDGWVREFIDKEYRQVVGTVRLVCGSQALAEDAVQEAIARAWEQRSRGRMLDRPAAWITTVALNVARSQMRRRKVERAARSRLVSDPSTDDLATVSAEAQVVRDALRGLPRRQREVTVLRYYGGLDVAEIAEWLDIAEGTVKAMLFRARRSLARVLAVDER